MLEKKYLVLAKIEVTQFTDPTPTKTANAILATELKITPLRVEQENRNLVYPYLGNGQSVAVMEEAMAEFAVEMAGSGTAGTAPAWGPLVRACGFAETITPATSAAYNPVSTGWEYLTFWCYQDGLLYKFTGAAGNVVIDMAAKRIPKLRFRFVGKYVAVTDVAFVTDPTLTGWKTPVASIPSNTGTVTVGGYAAKMAALQIDMQNDVQHALWMNNETNGIVERAPRGSLTVEAVTIATKDYFSAIRTPTTQVLTYTHGVTGGYKVKLDAPVVQLLDIEQTTFGGQLAFRMNANFNPSSGNDELVITAL